MPAIPSCVWLLIVCVAIFAVVVFDRRLLRDWRIDYFCWLMPGKEKMTVKMCPVCGEQRPVRLSEFKRTGHTRCKRCMLKQSRFNLRAPSR